MRSQLSLRVKRGSLSAVVLLIGALLVGTMLVLSTGGAFAQIGDPASRIDRMTRQREALKRRTDALATLLLSYESSGKLTSSLEKTNPQSLILRATVDGALVKGLARGRKPKVAEGIEQGRLRVEATWTRPGTRLRARCEAELQVGFQEVHVYPSGGTENFSCRIFPRFLPDEIFEEWNKALEADETLVVAACAESEEMGSAGFWMCVDRSGLSLPEG